MTYSLPECVGYHTPNKGDPLGGPLGSWDTFPCTVIVVPARAWGWQVQAGLGSRCPRGPRGRNRWDGNARPGRAAVQAVLGFCPWLVTRPPACPDKADVLVTTGRLGPIVVGPSASSKAIAFFLLCMELCDFPNQDPPPKPCRSTWPGELPARGALQHAGRVQTGAFVRPGEQRDAGSASCGRSHRAPHPPRKPGLSPSEPL